MKLQDQSLFRQQCYVDGAWADADSGEAIDVTNPATGEVNKIIVPMNKGYVVLPRAWTRDQPPDELQYAVTPLGANRVPLAETQYVRVAQ